MRRRACGGSPGALVRACAWVAAALLTGCSHLAPIEQGPTHVGRARVHVVRAGETLYSIAWQRGLDLRDLARWNGIRDPNVLRAGQRLLLAPPPTLAASPRAERQIGRAHV